MTRYYARAPYGERAYDDVPKNRWPNINIIGAIGIDGIIASKKVQGSVTGKVFKAFLEEELNPVLKGGHIVLMDNLPAHIVKRVSGLIESRGAKLIYLPPYSPEFNPIEHCWSKVKAYLRKVKPRSVQQLNDAIEEALKIITANDAKGWFKHCGYKVAKSLCLSSDK